MDLVADTRNLTQVEAERRSRILDVTSYDITVDLTGEQSFRSTTVVTFTCREPGADTFIEVAATALRAATLNGSPLAIDEWTAKSGLNLPNLEAENALVVDADFAYSTSGQGLHRSVDPADDQVYLYSQFEIADAQRVFACFDQPDLKSTFTWHVRVPQGWKVISNAPPAQVDEQGVVHMQPSVRMSTYITAVCAGPFDEIREQHNRVDLGIFVRQSVRQYLDADELFRITRQGLDFFQNQFGQEYPLPKYDHVCVPEFNAAAMENFGCVVLEEERCIFRSSVTDFEREQRATDMLHEMAHMWFGNLVTMRWWDDLWLKESFAEWAAYWCAVSATRFKDAWTGFLAIRKNWGYRQDQLSSTHPVYCAMPDIEAVEVNFDGITYAKGASVLKQLVAYLGQDVFVGGLRRYFATHAWQNATFDNLLHALDPLNEHRLTHFAAEWLQTSQVNTLRPAIAVGADGTYTSVAVDQEAPAAYPTLRTHRIGIGLYDLVDQRLRRRQAVAVTVSGPRTNVSELSGVRAADLLLLNDDDLTYAKIRLDPGSLQVVLEHLSSMESSLARALCWSAAWDMVRDAELRARDFVQLVCSALPAETDINLVTSVLRQVQTAIDLYCAPEWAASGRQQIGSVARTMLDSASDGLQLAWARAFVWSASDLAALRRWLSSDGAPTGLAVDAELRWDALTALVAHRAASEADIDAEEHRDPTSTGAEAAARARALLPKPEAKANAWRKLTTETLPNWLQRALLDGFYHPSQLELTRPYIPGYFASIREYWETHELQTAQAFIRGAYPSVHLERGVVQASDAVLADPSQPQPMRRVVQEGRDGVLRAIAARARDLSAD
jgi:aminopeptidase N